MSRRKAREKVVQALYQIDLSKCGVQDALETGLSEGGISDPEYVRGLLTGTVFETERLDQILGQYSKGWEIGRMASVDRNILRLALYELLFTVDTPPHVVVNEAIELAKKFSTEESGRFINGILGKILPQMESLRQEVKQD